MTSTAQDDMRDKLRNHELAPKEADTAEPMSAEERAANTARSIALGLLKPQDFPSVFAEQIRQAEQAAYERGRESGAKKFAEEMAEEFERQGFPLIAGRISALANSSEPGEDT